MAYTNPVSFGAFYYVLLALFTALIIAVKQPQALKRIITPSPAFWLVALFMAAMIVSHFTALALSKTAYMIAVKRLSVLFAIIYGVWWFNEHGFKRNLIAGSMMVAGVALILIKP